MVLSLRLSLFLAVLVSLKTVTSFSLGIRISLFYLQSKRGLERKSHVSLSTSLSLSAVNLPQVTESNYLLKTKFKGSVLKNLGH